METFEAFAGTIPLAGQPALRALSACGGWPRSKAERGPAAIQVRRQFVERRFLTGFGLSTAQGRLETGAPARGEKLCGGRRFWRIARQRQTAA